VKNIYNHNSIVKDDTGFDIWAIALFNNIINQIRH
jgi:hypothetical protein